MSKLCLLVLLAATVLVEARQPSPEENVELGGVSKDGRKLWQGDMILSDEQVRQFYGPQGGSRKAEPDWRYRWTNNRVPYRFDTEWPVGDLDIVRKGMDHWEELTCLTFHEETGVPNYPHMIFTNGGGCWSYVGMQYMNNPHGQQISIGGGCQTLGIVAHEVGHAIGFQHEQCRPDRDNYVRIEFDNIPEGQKYNFDMINNINDYGIPYDYSSLMHYEGKAFSINGKNTITPLDIHKTFVIGSRGGLSFADLKLANIIYNCSDRCSSKPVCQNGGYVDKHCQCQCPSGFAGNVCQNPVAVPGPSCGGVYNFEATITSPNYPGNYPEYSQCVYDFQAPANKRVQVTFNEFQVLYRNDEGNCVWDWTEVRLNSDDITQLGQMYCDRDLKGVTLTSEGNRLAILFSTVSNYFAGFEATVKFI